jgi:anti-sigma factor RsiW
MERETGGKAGRSGDESRGFVGEERAMITCRELVGFLDDYLSDELAREERDAFEEHLRACPDCVAYLSTYETTVALSKEALVARDEVPDEIPASLVEGILAARARKR